MVNVKSNSILLIDFVWSKPKKHFQKTYSIFHFKEVRVNETFKLLIPGMLKDAAISIAKPLTHVIKAFLKTGMVPVGIVTPIYKSEQELDIYRAVTMLPVCSNIFEKCVHKKVSELLEERSLLSTTQFGFRKKMKH